MPTLTYLGHAGLRVASASTAVTFDPWLSDEGAFLGSWHQFPRNDHLDVDAILDCDWVVVSHEHLDHMDAGALSRLRDSTRVLIPHYPSRVFRNRLAEIGVRRVVELDAWEPMALDTHGSWICAIPEQSPMCHDSAFLVSVGGRSILNCNDARLTAAQARRAAVLAGGRLDVMAVQTSGASWHPLRYGYPPDKMREIEQNKRLSKFRAVMRLVRAAEPRLAVPFAGPPCFLDDELRVHNSSIAAPGVFPDMEQATAWLTEHLPRQQWACFRPGDALDLDDFSVRADPVSAAFSYTSGLVEYLDRYASDRRPAIERAKARYPVPAEDFRPLFAAHFTRLGSLSPWFMERIGMTLRFVVLGPFGGAWDVTMGETGLVVDLEGRSSHADYTLQVEGRWLLAVLRGQLGWEDLLLSLRFDSRRDPDVYNDYLFGLLKHANGPALRAVEAYETGRDTSERVLVSSQGSEFEIARYCPHAGEDLTEGAVVEGGSIRCLAHNFRYDLQTGECVNARSDRLATRKVQDARLTG